MKKIFTISALVLLCTVMFAGGTDESPKGTSGIAVMKGTERSLFKVYYKGAEAANVKITILNEKDEKVFSETIRKVDGFIRPYNFGNLEEGIYTIRIEDGSAVQAEKVEYRSGEIEKLVQVRKMSSEEGKYLLTASGEGKEEVTINIYDPADQLLFTETQSIKDTLAKVYNLKKVKGNIVFEIIHANGSFQRLKY